MCLLKQLAHIGSFTMPAKQKKRRGRGRVAATPHPLTIESVHAPAASDEESSRASTVSDTVGTKKRRKSQSRDRNNTHGKMIARMFIFLG